MEYISKNPGLQQIIERIFSELEYEVLLKCQDVNTSWKNLLKNPITWLKIPMRQERFTFPILSRMAQTDPKFE